MRVVRSLLHPADLAHVVTEQYEIEPPVTASLLQRGFNDAYLMIGADRGRSVLRVYARDKYWLGAESDICFELELLDYLAAAGHPVAHPYRRRSGELLGWLDAPEGRRGYALFTYAPGRPLAAHPFDERLWHRVGTEIAQLHRAMNAFESKNSRYHLDLQILVDMPLTAIKPYVTPEEADTYSELVATGQRLKDTISEIARVPERYGPIHADAHDGNIHVAADGTFTLFDFDHCGVGWRAYDLAPFYCRPTADEQDLQKWTAFLAGYEDVRLLGTAERAALPAFKACRALWDVGDWLRASHWTGDAWAREGLCARTLERVRKPLDEQR
jgi:Ser/Thr protein kinase RdoA (MazF antagonist)